MRAAIYARKSTDDSDRDLENKSVTRQIERARAYAKAKGWTLDEEHVYVDDGISGAEFENRPGFARLLASLPKRRKAPFDALIMSEASRLGRDQRRNGYYLAHIHDSGVRVFYYLTDEEEKADTPEQALMFNLRSYAAEVERLKAGQRSRDALARKAAKGYNAGGVVYGYDNVPIYAMNGDGERTKTHTDYRINETEADVLRRMFRMYADGHGLVTVAKAMNGDPRYAELSRRYFDGMRPPAPRKGTGSWAPSSVRKILYNQRYTGIVPFGRKRKVYRQGTKARVRQPDSEVLRAARPDLRIIHDDLWGEVQARLASVRKTYLYDTNGARWGRPGMGAESKYLLTGLGTCGCCQANIAIIGGRTGSPGRRHPIYYYGCNHHKLRGSTVCGNDLRARMEEADALVLDKVRRFLTPEAIDFTIDEAMRLLAERKREHTDLPERLQADLRKERKQIERLVTAIANGDAPDAVMEKIRALQASVAAKEHELEGFTVKEPTELELKRLRRACCERLGRFDQLMVGDVSHARQALRKLLVERIAFRPVEAKGARSYHLRWSYTLKPLFDEGYLGVASPRGFEPRLPP